MLGLRDSRNFSRTFTAGCLVLAPVVFLVSDVVDPAWADDSAAYMAQVAAAPDRYAAAGLLRLVAAMLLVGGLIGVLHLLRGRRVTVGQVGAGLLIVGAVGINFYPLAIIEVMATEAGFDQQAVVAVLEAAESSGWAMVYFVVFFLGLGLGSLLLALGVWLRRAAPIWVPVFLVGFVALGFAGTGQVTSIIGSVLMLAALGGLAMTMLRLSDEQWAQWQVLPDRPRREKTPAAEAPRPSVA